jgi:hypothetical protein
MTHRFFKLFFTPFAFITLLAAFSIALASVQRLPPKEVEVEVQNAYLHPYAKLGIGLPGDKILNGKRFPPLMPKKAAAYAVQKLKNRGVSGIIVCESHWIAGAISGYLIDCQGKWVHNKCTYTQFRVGIRDGLEAKYGEAYQAGTEFAFIALGSDRQKKPLWYPVPGPDYSLKPGESVTNEMLAYEFLLWKKKFLSLAKRYPIKKEK